MARGANLNKQLFVPFPLPEQSTEQKSELLIGIYQRVPHARNMRAQHGQPRRVPSQHVLPPHRSSAAAMIKACAMLFAHAAWAQTSGTRTATRAFPHFPPSPTPNTTLPGVGWFSGNWLPFSYFRPAGPASLPAASSPGVAYSVPASSSRAYTDSRYPRLAPRKTFKRFTSKRRRRPRNRRAH